MLSFLEVTSDFSARFGAALPEEVQSLTLSRPGIRVYVREPSGANARIRLGTAKITDQGIVDDPLSEQERRGAWVGSVLIAIGTLKSLRAIAEHELKSVMSFESPVVAWLVLDLRTGMVSAWRTPKGEWASANDSEFEVLAQCSGTPAQILEFLAHAGSDIESADDRES